MVELSLIVCCSAEGNFVPSYCIFKGRREKNKFEEGIPPGFRVTVNGTQSTWHQWCSPTGRLAEKSFHTKEGISKRSAQIRWPQVALFWSKCPRLCYTEWRHTTVSSRSHNVSFTASRSIFLEIVEDILAAVFQQLDTQQSRPENNETSFQTFALF